MWCPGGLPGWQEYAIVDGDSEMVNHFPADLDALFQISVISSAAATAYFGLTECGELTEGDSVLDLRGGRIDRLDRGADRRQPRRVRGRESPERTRNAAGSSHSAPTPASIVTPTTSPPVSRTLRPKGFDVYFDNVGGPTLDLALRRLAIGGRVVIVGAISMYNEGGRPPGPSNYLNLINKQAKMVGFQGLAWMPRYPEAWDQMWQWKAEGKLDYRADIEWGLESCVDQLNSLFTGKNVGKALVQLCDDPGPGPYAAS